VKLGYLISISSLLCLLAARSAWPAEDPEPPDAPAGIEIPVIDTDNDGLSDLEEAAIGTLPHDPDSDGDGLLDGWEVNGTRGEPLADYGCDPLVRDVLVEIDWMRTADGDPRPFARDAYFAALDVYRFFASSDSGIRIHFDLGAEIGELLDDLEIDPEPGFERFAVRPDTAKVVPHQDLLPLRPVCGGASSVRSLWDIYHDPRYFRPSRHNLFYYVLLATSGQRGDMLGRNATGIVSGFADDRSRSLGLWPTGVLVAAFFREPAADLPAEPRRYYLAASLLHELGHCFGLGHGGARPDGSWDNTNYKPNYPSIMNHRFQLWGVDRTESGPVLAFSHGANRSLDERNLVEAAGIGSLPSDHVLQLLRVEHVDDPRFPENIDWNGNGSVDDRPFGMDVNADQVVDREPLDDHDDWGKLERDGFDGIGLNAHRLGGVGCGEECELRRYTGDFDGDGDDDLFLHLPNRVAFFASDGAAGFGTRPTAILDGSIDSWTFAPGDLVFVVDLDDDPAAEVLLHRRRHVAVIDFADGLPRVVWSGERTEGDDAETWAFTEQDHCLSLRLGTRGPPAFLVTNQDDAAVLRMRDGRLVSQWNSDRPLREWTAGETPVFHAGRTVDGGGTFLLASARTLCEFRVAGDGISERRVDADGTIESADAATSPWELSGMDCYYAADLDGDGTDELVVRSADTLGVLRETEEDPSRLEVVWSTRGSVDGWPLGSDDRLVCGAFRNGSDEVLIFNGQSLIALAWNRDRQALEHSALANGFILPFGLGVRFPLRSTQRITTGRFVRGLGTLIAIQDDERFLVATLTEDDGFRQIRLEQPTLEGWPIRSSDQIAPFELDGDEASELFLQDRTLWGIVDFATSPDVPALRLAARIDVESLELQPLPRFRRGDTNHDGFVDLSDVIVLLQFLFQGRSTIECESAGDADDNGHLEISDAIRVLNFLFAGGTPPAVPGPRGPGIDPTEDELECAAGES